MTDPAGNDDLIDNLINAAVRHRARTEDPELAAQLKVWLDILPRLA